jgi:hypothetical protein
MIPMTFPVRSLAVLACAGALSAAAFAGPSTSAAGDAQSKYEHERAACASGRTGQARETCLKEAGAALAEARKGTQDSRPAGSKANATARCDALKGDEHTDCLARMNGEGSVSGSVEGGGLLREKKTIVQGAPQVQPSPSK